jgi:hypothetical protein
MIHNVRGAYETDILAASSPLEASVSRSSWSLQPPTSEAVSFQKYHKASLYLFFFSPAPPPRSLGKTSMFEQRLDTNGGRHQTAIGVTVIRDV